MSICKISAFDAIDFEVIGQPQRAMPITRAHMATCNICCEPFFVRGS